jgi:hypothetical protein
VKVDAAREKAIKASQEAVTEAGDALVLAPQSRPVNVASKAIETASQLNDQIAGPLTVAEQASIRQRVALLTSDNEALRNQGESLRQENQKAVESLSDTLAHLQVKLDAAQAALPEAQRREAAVANQYRNLVFGAYALGVIVLLLAGGYVYLRVAYGSLPSVIGGLVSKVYVKHPDQAASIESMLKEVLSPSQIAKIFGHSA